MWHLVVIFLCTLNLQSFLSLFVFYDIDRFGKHRLVFCRMALNLRVWCFLQIRSGYTFWAGILPDHVLGTSHQETMMSVCPIISLCADLHVILNHQSMLTSYYLKTCFFPSFNFYQEQYHPIDICCKPH
jgi:hypothetical protein